MNMEMISMVSRRRTHRSNISYSFFHHFLFILLLLFLLGTASASLSCSLPRAKYGEVKVKETMYNGRYPNGSQALVSCDPGYHLLKYGEIIYCQNGRWITSDRSRVQEEHLCERDIETRCDAAPDLTHGYFRPVTQQFLPGYSSTESDHPVGTELQAVCENTYSLNCQHQMSCGKIVCSQRGVWVPQDGTPIVCAAIPQTVVSGTSREGRLDDYHGLRNPSPTQNYLILALALVCIVGVAALTIALLRRPLFCKKRDQSGMDPQVVVTSSSPHHVGMGGGSDLDSIPVAMNTGIFIPGMDYNLQDYHLQEGPICGTAVFK